MIQSPVFWFTLFCAALIYWSVPVRYRFSFLALVSYIYLASLEPVGMTALIVWVLLFFYVAPLALAARNYSVLVLPGLVFAVLSYLIWHKYLPIFAAFLEGASPGLSIAAPLGISYFTFKLIHYAVETARGNISDRSLSRFFCYIFLFPIFTAGPIERFDHFLAHTENHWRCQTMVEGLTRISHGLIKKFVLAKFATPYYLGMGVPGTASALVTGIGEYAPYQIWLFLAVTYLYAYLDFSAYSDIAIGAARLFGFRIMENFRFPILAVNISDFWKRWHMTLAGWCQNYIYMPVLARTRTPYAAVFCTFIAMGLWHGANAGWLLWGLYHASGVALYMSWARFARKFNWWRRATKGRLRYLGIPATFAFVSGSYAFSSTGHGGQQALNVFAALFGINLGL